MGSASVLGAAQRRPRTASSQQAVQSNKNAIGYVSLDFVNGLSTTPYNGVACNLRNAKSGEYGGVRNFWMVTRGRPRPATRPEVHHLDPELEQGPGDRGQALGAAK